MLGDVPTVNPNEFERVPGKQENTSPNVTLPENDRDLVDTGTLMKKELELRNYLNTDKIPLSEREKRTGEYETLVAEIEGRERAE